MKTIISILAMILLVINMSSCTPQSLTDDDTITATTGDIEQVIPPREDDD